MGWGLAGVPRRECHISQSGRSIPRTQQYIPLCYIRIPRRYRLIPRCPRCVPRTCSFVPRKKTPLRRGERAPQQARNRRERWCRCGRAAFGEPRRPVHGVGVARPRRRGGAALRGGGVAPETASEQLETAGLLLHPEPDGPRNPPSTAPPRRQAAARPPRPSPFAKPSQTVPTVRSPPCLPRSVPRRRSPQAPAPTRKHLPTSPCSCVLATVGPQGRSVAQTGNNRFGRPQTPALRRPRSPPLRPTSRARPGRCTCTAEPGFRICVGQVPGLVNQG